MHRQLKIFLAGFCGVTLLGGIILFALAFSIVEITQWGLVYDNFNQELDAKPSSSTRALIGIANSYLTFPRTTVNIEFSGSPSAQSNTIEAWTKDGLNIFLDLTFQFILRPERLKDLYLEYGPHWYAAVVRMMYSRIKEMSVNFKTTDYFENREEIANKFSEILTETFNVDFDNMMYLYDLQLIDINFEQTFEDVLIQKLNMAQSVQTSSIKRNVTLINKEIQLIEAQADNQIRIEFAKASANGLVATQAAEGDAFFTLFNQTTTAYAGLLTTPSYVEMLQVIYATELPYTDANGVYINPKNVLLNQ